MLPLYRAVADIRLERECESGGWNDVIQPSAIACCRNRCDHLRRERRQVIVDIEAEQHRIRDSDLEPAADGYQGLHSLSLRENRNVTERLKGLFGSSPSINLRPGAESEIGADSR